MAEAPTSPGSLLRRPSALPLALALYLLTALALGGLGVVGEVGAAWTWGPPPRVAVALEGGHPTWSGPGHEPHAGHALGPLRASWTRPTERLQVGSLWLPLAVNSYTGGPPDWPARAVHGLSGSWRAVRGLHLLLGAGLLVGMAALLRAVGLRELPGVALLVLATDWCFVFYRHALGGTELTLLAGGLLLLGARGRRRGGGPPPHVLMGLALGLGLLAKATFLPTAVAFGLASLLTRWDRPGDITPAPLRPGRVLLLVALCTAPLWIAALHTLALPEAPVRSHDGLSMQLGRVGVGLKALLAGEGGAAREAPETLLWFLLEPLRWFAPALGGREVSWGCGAARVLGWGIALTGVALAWAGRPWRSPPGPHDALLRWLSIAAPSQVLLLWLANHDLHHLAQAAPTMALLVGLGVERLARRLARSAPSRSALAMLLCLPLVAAGFVSVARTADVVDSVPAPAITEQGQRAIQALLEEHEVRQLWTCDYDLYGVLELRSPELELSHAWGAASAGGDRQATLRQLLLAARGAHLLLVRSAAPRIYDLSPRDAQVQRAAAAVGVDAVLVGSIEGEGWARLYRIGQPRQSPESGVISPP